MAGGGARQGRVVAGILDAAAAVLAERGESASMAEIAEATGVGRATLYRYFPTRDDLVRGLVEAAVEDVIGRIDDAAIDTVPVTEGIARLTRGFLAAGGKYAALANTRPADKADLEPRLTEPVRALLRRGVKDGTLRDDLPEPVLFAMLTGLLERTLYLVLRHELGGEQAAAAITSVFLDGAARRVDRAGPGQAP